MARRIQSGRVLKPTTDVTLVEKLDLRPVSVGGVQKFLAIANQPIDLSIDGSAGLYEDPIIESNRFIVKFTGNAETMVCHVIPECDPANPPIAVGAYYDKENNLTTFSADQPHSDTQPGPFSKIEVRFLDSNGSSLIRSFRSDVKNIRVGSGLLTIHKLPAAFPLNGTCVSYVSEGELLEGVNIGDLVSVDANFNTEHLLCLVEGISSEKRWVRNPNGSDENIVVIDWIYGLRIISGAPRKDSAVYRMPYSGDELNIGDEVEFDLTIKATDDQTLLDLTEGMKVRLDAYDTSFHYMAQILEINEKIGKLEIVEGANDNPDPCMSFKVAILAKSTNSLNTPINIKYYQYKTGDSSKNNVTVNAVGDLSGLTLGIIYNGSVAATISDSRMVFIYNPETKTSTATATVSATVNSIEAAFIVPTGTSAVKNEYKIKSLAQVFCNGEWI